MLNILRKNKIIILLPIIIFSFYLLSQNVINNAGIGLEFIPVQICIKSNCFDIEIADTMQKRETGLMNREYLASDVGMLFIFENEEVHSFWMKNTSITLDIIWIDGNNKIIFIKENAQPCKIEKCELFTPNEKAKYVLEINGGLTEEMGFDVGDEISFK